MHNTTRVAKYGNHIGSAVSGTITSKILDVVNSATLNFTPANVDAIIDKQLSYYGYQYRSKWTRRISSYYDTTHETSVFFVQQLSYSYFVVTQRFACSGEVVVVEAYRAGDNLHILAPELSSEPFVESVKVTEQLWQDGSTESSLALTHLDGVVAKLAQLRKTY